MTQAAHDRRWWVLIGTCFGLFLLMLDSTVVNLALPDIQRDLDASSPEVQWVANVYLLVLAALVVSAGRLGDLVGRKRVFQAGMVIFVAGAVVAAVAPDPLVLILGRVLQGVGASALLTLSLALVAGAFPDAQRGRALGIWAAVSGIALAVGPLVGGWLVEYASWRWIFWIDVPLGIAGIAITAWAARETRDETARGGIDVPGLVTLAGGLSLVVLALVQGRSWGWTSAATLAAAGVGLALLVAFWVVEHRVQNPIVDFALFRNGPYFGASAAGFALVGAYWSVLFFEPQYLQNILGDSPLEAGVLILPITVPLVVLSPFTASFTRLIGVRALMTLGMALGLAGLLVLTQVDAGTGYPFVLVGYLLFGLALGVVYAAMSTAAMEAMPAEKSGVASGVLAMDRVLAGAVMLAVCGALFQHFSLERLSSEMAAKTDGVTTGSAGELDGLLAGAPSAVAELEGQPPEVAATVREVAAEAYTYGLSYAMWALVGVMVVGTVLTWLFVRPTDPNEAPERRRIAHHVARHGTHL